MRQIPRRHSDDNHCISSFKVGLRPEKCRPRNYINFIGEEKGSRTLKKVPLKSEKKIDTLQTEIDGLCQTGDKVFQTLPTEWIEDRLPNSEICLRLTPTI